MVVSAGGLRCGCRGNKLCVREERVKATLVVSLQHGERRQRETEREGRSSDISASEGPCNKYGSTSGSAECFCCTRRIP
jgi:hypothetical protein